MSSSATPDRRASLLVLVLSTLLIMGLVLSGPAAADPGQRNDRAAAQGPQEDPGRPDHAAGHGPPEHAAQDRQDEESVQTAQPAGQAQGPSVGAGADRRGETQGPKGKDEGVGAQAPKGKDDRQGATSGAVSQGSAAGDDPDRTPADPPGNRGSVKVDGRPFDTHVANEPHPGCDFRVLFFGFVDSYADVTFDAHAPTGGARLISAERVHFPDGAANRRGNELAGTSRVFDLVPLFEAAGIAPHPRNGYHVKLTVHSENTHGNDVKHKVFWINCDTATSEAAQEPAAREVAVPTVSVDRMAGAPAVETTSRMAQVIDGGTTPHARVQVAGDSSDQVLGLVVERTAPAAPAATTVTAASSTAPAQLARTGLDAPAALVLALLLLGLGGTLLRRSRTRAPLG